MARVVYFSIRDHEEFGKRFLEDVVDFIRDHFDPEDIFDESALEDWAEENGWSQEEGA